MSSGALLGYAAAVVIAVATPGPAMVALIGRGLARGRRAALHMAFGIAMGDVLLGAFALFGLAALMTHYSELMTVVKFAGAGYLAWLGVRMLRTLPTFEPARVRGQRDLLIGFAVALSNPKAILFHASLLPLVVDLRRPEGSAIATILSIIFLGNLVVMSGYGIAAGAGSKRFESTAGSKWLARLGGGVMIGSGAAIAIH